MNCRNCEDTGLRFDTYCPCTECALGAPIAYEQNKTELSQVLMRANTLRLKILNYENKNLKGKSNDYKTPATTY